MKVEWSKRARARLREEAKWIGHDRPIAAHRLIVRITMAAQRLEQFPFSGRRVGEVTDPPVRELIVGSYRIIYLPEAETVRIVTVKHSREKLTRAEIRRAVKG